MKPYTKYTESFKEQALAKVYNRNNDQTIPSIADDLNISCKTAFNFFHLSALIFQAEIKFILMNQYDLNLKL
jgi:hypothetical protein